MNELPRCLLHTRRRSRRRGCTVRVSRWGACRSCSRCPFASRGTEGCCSSTGRTRSPSPWRRKWSRVARSHLEDISALGRAWFGRSEEGSTSRRTGNEFKKCNLRHQNICKHIHYCLHFIFLCPHPYFRQIISIIQEAKKFHLFAIQSTRFSLDVLGEPPALSAPRHRPSAFGQRREGDFKEVVHALDVLHEEVKLQLEYLQRVLQHRTKVRFAEGDQVELEKKY